MKVPTLTKKSEDVSHVVEENIRFKKTPSWWVSLFAYLLAVIFCYLIHRFFLWLPPYLYEIFKNLRGLPDAWANLGMFWAQWGLRVAAIAAALYHQFWQIGTRYILTDKEIRIEHWFPLRKVISVPLGAVRRYSFEQNWIGVLLNFGVIEIDTASLSLVVLPSCPNPKLFLDILKSQNLFGSSDTHN